MYRLFDWTRLEDGRRKAAVAVDALGISGYAIFDPSLAGECCLRLFTGSLADGGGFELYGSGSGFNGAAKRLASGARREAKAELRRASTAARASERMAVMEILDRLDMELRTHEGQGSLFGDGPRPEAIDSFPDERPR
ncbi:MAG: hypothetical protein FWG74_01650 [Planctomycetes bacterium]|nr:hypothetical protein [Planctomycetota bacterium]